MQFCVQNIPSFMTKRMIGITLLRTKHTAFHVPRQKCNWGHGAHNFAQSAGFSIHLVIIHPSLFHNGKPQIILCLFCHSLEVDVLLCGQFDVLGKNSIHNSLTSLIHPDIDKRTRFLPGWRPKVADVDINNHSVPGSLIPCNDMVQHTEM